MAQRQSGNHRSGTGPATLKYAAPLLAGATASSFETLLMFPLDTVKTRFQLAETGHRNMKDMLHRLAFRESNLIESIIEL